MYDVVDGWYVQPSCCDISCEENRIGRRFESAKLSQSRAGNRMRTEIPIEVFEALALL